MGRYLMDNNVYNDQQIPIYNNQRRLPRPISVSTIQKHAANDWLTARSEVKAFIFDQWPSPMWLIRQL